MTAQTKISSKGQVVIPKEVRECLHLDVGTELDISEIGGAIVLRRAVPFKKDSFEACTARIRAAVSYSGPRYSREEERAAIDEMFRTSGRYS